jgi:tetratricopeptide (TPR) repeat protein
MVSDAESQTRIDGVRVELRAFTGGTIATAFTSGNGNFQFNDISRGSYELFVEEQGYATARQRVDVEGSTMGIFVELRSVSGTTPPSSRSPSVSARELSIPHKAHDAMDKGRTLLYAKSNYAASVKQFEHAAQEYPGYYEAYTEMGIAYLKMDDAANSERVLRKALDLSDQHYRDALFWLASLLSSKERFAESEPLARKGVEVDPNSWQANAELARALLGLGRAAEAETAAFAAVKFQPENPTLHLLLANIHGELQDGPALLDDLDAYLKLAPKGPFADQVRKQRDEVRQALQNSKTSSAPSLNQNP